MGTSVKASRVFISRMKIYLLICLVLITLTSAAYLPKSSIDYRDYDDRRNVDLSELEDVYNYLYARNRRSNFDTENKKIFNRVYRGNKPLFLSNHADAVLRGLG